jgi:hypothetical protein
LLSLRLVVSAILLLVAASLQLGCATYGWTVRSPADVPIVLAPDLPTLIALMSSDEPPPGSVIAIPTGTKGRVVDRKFLKDGGLVSPYPASANDLHRDGAIEVLLFEVTEGPGRGSKGWVQASFLRPDFKYLYLALVRFARPGNPGDPFLRRHERRRCQHGALWALGGKAMARFPSLDPAARVQLLIRWAILRVIEKGLQSTMPLHVAKHLPHRELTDQRRAVSRCASANEKLIAAARSEAV